MKKIFLILLVFMILTGCADVSPHVSDCITSDPAGFWSGLWHGLILPVSIFGRLLSDDIAIYAYNNNGGWYDLGFVFGAGGIGFNLGFFNTSK